MKAVLISIRPKWCELIASGKKTVEVRKTAPHIKTPFKCYIYCTNNGDTLYSVNGKVQPCNSFEINLKENSRVLELNGYVIGEFVCDGIQDITYCDDGEHQHYQWVDAPAWAFFLNQKACLTDEELKKYLTTNDGYGWHISDLVIYDEPKKLSEFTGLRKTKFGYAPYEIKRPPQSWCYVESLEGGTDNA